MTPRQNTLIHPDRIFNVRWNDDQEEDFVIRYMSAFEIFEEIRDSDDREYIVHEILYNNANDDDLRNLLDNIVSILSIAEYSTHYRMSDSGGDTDSDDESEN